MSLVSILAVKQVQTEPCLFCKVDDTSIAGGPGGAYYFVKCNNCAAKGPTHSDAAEAVNLWNSALHEKQTEIAALKLDIADLETALIEAKTATISVGLAP